MVLAFQTNLEQYLLAGLCSSFAFGSYSPRGTVLQLQRHNRSRPRLFCFVSEYRKRKGARFPPAKQIAQIISKVFILFLCVLCFSAGEHLCTTDRHFVNFPPFINAKSVAKGVCTRQCCSKESSLLLQL